MEKCRLGVYSSKFPNGALPVRHTFPKPIRLAHAFFTRNERRRRTASLHRRRSLVGVLVLEELHTNTQKLGPCDLYRGAEISLGNLQATDGRPILMVHLRRRGTTERQFSQRSDPTVPCEDKGFRAPTEASPRRERSYQLSRGTRGPSSPIWRTRSPNLGRTLFVSQSFSSARRLSSA